MDEARAQDGTLKDQDRREQLEHALISVKLAAMILRPWAPPWNPMRDSDPSNVQGAVMSCEMAAHGILEELTTDPYGGNEYLSGLFEGMAPPRTPGAV